MAGAVVMVAAAVDVVAIEAIVVAVAVGAAAIVVIAAIAAIAGSPAFYLPVQLVFRGNRPCARSAQSS